MAQQLDQAQIMNSAMEKKAKQFDRIVGEWKHKVGEKQTLKQINSCNSTDY